jgi:uncharacterized protein
MWQTNWTLGLVGGLMIGCAAAIYLVMNGRIMGASGILGGLVDGSGKSNRAERATFIAALIAAPALAALAFGAPETHATRFLAILLAGGLLVGLGTRIGSGCTSGHGVCGISRLSRRSIIATLVFLLSGAVTMLIARHLLGVI